MSDVHVAHFVITGEALMRHARALMLEDEPGKAYRLLAQGLVGDGADEVVRKVLAGELDLNGDSRVGVGVEPAGEDVGDYLECLSWQYAGRVKIDNRWYRPRAIVTSYGPEDAKSAGPCPTRLDKPACEAWSRLRAEYYACPGERVEFVERVRIPSEGTLRGAYVVLEPCGEPPQWMKPCASAQVAVDEFAALGRELEEIGALTARPSNEARMLAREHELDDDEADELLELAQDAENEELEARCASIGERVREQAGDDVFELVLGDGRTVQVPRAPFTWWVLRRLERVDKSTLPAWNTVSESGMKLQNDDPYHTDWVLGAGLSLAESYDNNVQRAAWRHAAELQYESMDND